MSKVKIVLKSSTKQDNCCLDFVSEIKADLRKQNLLAKPKLKVKKKMPYPKNNFIKDFPCVSSQGCNKVHTEKR